MGEKYFHIVVKKMMKYRNKIINVQKIKTIVHHILDDRYSDSKAYKIIHHLKNKWYLLQLKKDVLLVKSPEFNLDENLLLERYYWEILYNHSKEYCASNWYIWWLKALELFVNNYDIPDEIFIYNKEKVSTEVVLLDKKMMFKKYTHKNKNLRSLVKKFTYLKQIWNKTFKVANLELAILESLYNMSILNQGYINEFVKKILRKYKKHLNYDIFKNVLRAWKHHASINRLLQISKIVDPNLAENIEQIIKTNSFLLSI